MIYALRWLRRDELTGLKHGTRVIRELCLLAVTHEASRRYFLKFLKCGLTSRKQPRTDESGAKRSLLTTSGRRPIDVVDEIE